MIAKIHFLKLGFIFFGIFLASCEGLTGMDGIVKDIETGKKLDKVEIEMTSSYKTMSTITDSSGRFNTLHSYNCGIKKCDDSFTIKFKKKSYENLELNENYFSQNDNVEIIDGTTIIKLKKIEIE